MTELRTTLGIGGEPVVLDALKEWGGLKPGLRLGAMQSLFPRIMAAEARDEAPPAPAPAKAEAAAPVGVALIEYADFQKIQFRTAKVLEAEKVQGADKLLRLQIDVGGERRQIVAGIALHYEPAALIGKTVVVVANLKPAKIRGIESNGMLLAASAGKEMRVVTVDGDLPTGAVVK
jgi:methionyl-tRNA synthetase